MHAYIHTYKHTHIHTHIHLDLDANVKSSVFGNKSLGRGIGTLVIYKKYFVELLHIVSIQTTPYISVCIDAVLHRYCTVRSGPS